MLSVDQSTAPYMFVALALAVVLAGAAVVYLIEIRRAGSAPWSELYHDRVVPLYRTPHLESVGRRWSRLAPREPMERRQRPIRE